MVYEKLKTALFFKGMILYDFLYYLIMLGKQKLFSLNK